MVLFALASVEPGTFAAPEAGLPGSSPGGPAPAFRGWRPGRQSTTLDDTGVPASARPPRRACHAAREDLEPRLEISKSGARCRRRPGGGRQNVRPAQQLGCFVEQQRQCRNRSAAVWPPAPGVASAGVRVA
jgi:hypothetical protein